MATANQHLFVSYAREDLDAVQPVIDALREELAMRALPVDIWMDLASLRPGEQWDIAITDALQNSIGFLFFVSPRSMKSDWVRRELELAAVSLNRLLIPVILRQPPDMPQALANRQWIDLSLRKRPQDITRAAAAIAEATEKFLRLTPKPESPVSAVEAPVLAAQIADQVRTPPTIVEGEPTSNSVFVVHGHDTDLLKVVEEFLSSLGLKAVVLSREDRYRRSLLERFEHVATQAQFAIVLLSADDMGASRKQYDAPGVAGRALQFRARQNVILELGFFYGRLGWEKVFIVYKEPDRVFPNFERPSDLEGAIIDSVGEPRWRKNLRVRLLQAGFAVSGSA